MIFYPLGLAYHRGAPENMHAATQDSSAHGAPPSEHPQGQASVPANPDIVPEPTSTSAHAENAAGSSTRDAGVTTSRDEDAPECASFNEAPRLEAGNKPNGSGQNGQIDPAISEPSPKAARTDHTESNNPVQEIQGHEGAGVTTGLPPDAGESHMADSPVTRNTSLSAAHNLSEIEESETRDPRRTSGGLRLAIMPESSRTQPQDDIELDIMDTRGDSTGSDVDGNTGPAAANDAQGRTVSHGDEIDRIVEEEISEL